MPASYDILPDHNLFVVRFEGNITVDQNMECLLAYHADPLSDSGHHMLLDVEECRFPDRFFEETQRIVERLRPYHTGRDPRARTAIYAPTKVNFGICKLYERAVKARMPYPLIVTRDAEEALAYVDLNPKDAGMRALLHVPAIGRTAF